MRTGKSCFMTGRSDLIPEMKLHARGAWTTWTMFDGSVHVVCGPIELSN